LNTPNSIAIIGSDAAVNLGGPNACSDRGCDNVSTTLALLTLIDMIKGHPRYGMG
jgi:hypothetical protein